MYLDPPLSVRLKRHLRDNWVGYLGLLAVVVFLLFFDFSDRPHYFRNPFRWIWGISPLAYGVVVYALFIFIGVACVGALAMGLYSVFTGKTLFGYRTNRDLLEIKSKRSTFDPAKDRGDESNKQD